MLTKSNKYDIINLSVERADFLCQTAPLVCEKDTVLSTDRRTRGFLLGGKMRICNKCKKIKPFSEFYYRIKNKKRIPRTYCKICWLEHHRKYWIKYYRKYWIKYCKSPIYKKRRKEFLKQYPWVSHYRSALSRSKYRTTYIKRGMNMTIDDFKDLWFRDKAWLLKHPSIDRKNNKIGYIKENCHFIELSENNKKRKK